MPTILIIDDDPAIRKLLRLALGREGYEVIAESSTRSAIPQLRNDRIELVITDIIMPEKDGFEFILEMQSIRPELKAIAISGGLTSLDCKDCLSTAKSLGAVTALAKPIDIEQLLQTVRDVLDAELVAERVD